MDMKDLSGIVSGIGKDGGGIDPAELLGKLTGSGSEKTEEGAAKNDGASGLDALKDQLPKF